MLGKALVSIYPVLGHILGCLRRSAEIGGTFVPSHLQSVWDDQPDRFSSGGRHDVRKILPRLGLEDHPPVAIGKIHFGEVDVLLDQDRGHKAQHLREHLP
jgi:hypothetical protein